TPLADSRRSGRALARRPPPAAACLPFPLLLLPLHIGDVALDVLGRLGIGVAQRLGDRAHVGLRPGRIGVVDGLEELEAAGEADVGDRDVVAADESLAVEEEL